MPRVTSLWRTLAISATISTLMALGVATAWAAPTLTLDPTSGPPGSSVLVTGTGFGPSEGIDILFIQNSRTRFLASTTTDASGNFSTTVTIPSNATVGDATIRAQGAVSRIRKTATFSVTAPPQALIKLQPPSGPPGASLTVLGKGFAANEEVAILFIQDQSKFLGSTTTDGTGRFTVTVTIPNDADAGAATVEADGATSGQTATATFNVISTAPTLTLTPDTGPPLTSVLATGTHFGANEEVDILFIQDRTQGIGSVITDASGNFSVTIVIPDNAHAGTANMRAQGAVSRLQATTVFTVT